MKIPKSVLSAVAVPLIPLAVIGLRQILQRPATRRVGSGAGGEEIPPVTDPRFRELMDLFTGAPLRGGHTIEILLDGEGTYPRLWEDLRRAERSITFKAFYMSPGELMDTLVGILCDRARAGVRVLLLYDALGGSTFPGEHLRALRESGAEVGVVRPLWPSNLHKAQHRSHSRVAVIDGEIGYTGGFGIADQWQGDGKQPGQWRETNVRFTGPAVQQLQAAFASLWVEATGTLLTDAVLFPGATETSEDPPLAGLLYSKPKMGSTRAMRFFALSFAAARERLYLSIAYFVPTDTMMELMIAAAERGVDVRVLTANERSDVPFAWLAGRARYEKLLSAGIRIWEYEPAMMHAKTFVVDGRWCTIGAMNLDNRSVALMDETNLMVLDEEVSAQLESIFFDDLRRAKEIQLEEFRERAVWKRAAERSASAFSRLL